MTLNNSELSRRNSELSEQVIACQLEILELRKDREEKARLEGEQKDLLKSIQIANSDNIAMKKDMDKQMADFVTKGKKYIAELVNCKKDIESAYVQIRELRSQLSHAQTLYHDSERRREEEQQIIARKELHLHLIRRHRRQQAVAFHKWHSYALHDSLHHKYNHKLHELKHQLHHDHVHALKDLKDKHERKIAEMVRIADFTEKEHTGRMKRLLFGRNIL